jgi:hypothetical protein
MTALSAAERLRRLLPSELGPVLEIGPLDKPILPKSDYDVRYVDHAPAAALGVKYADEPNVGEIFDVDVVWDGGGDLRDAEPELGAVDWVVASHVLEHVPDPVGWLEKLASVLPVGGCVGLVIPDRRFTFDVNRRTSEPADFIDAYLRRATLPTYGQLYDFHTKALPVDPGTIWSGHDCYVGQVRPGELRREAYEDCLAQRSTGGFRDVHCHTFTPLSLLELFDHLTDLELTPYAVRDFLPTLSGSIEFVATFERLEPTLTAEDRRQNQREALTRAGDAAGAASTPVPPFLLSDRERRLIDAKRRLLIRLRRALNRPATPGDRGSP